MAFNPLELNEKVEKIVCKNDLKKYYRFRYAKFYGGIATADCLGCNLRCFYCWSQNKVWFPEKYGEFYSAEQVSEKLKKMMNKNKINRCRISGGEPLIGKEHLIKVIKLIPKDCLFILETNGILLDKEYIEELSKFKNLHIRLSLKASNPSMFEKITNAEKEFFNLQVKAIENLKNSNLNYSIAIMADFYNNERLKDVLKIVPKEKIEYENLIMFNFFKDKYEDISNSL